MPREIVLSNGTVALVDEADYATASAHRWHPRRCGERVYVETKIKRFSIGLHRLLLRPSTGQVVDHIDGNALNNVRSNLRVCSRAENNRNTRKCRRPTQSAFKGVARQGRAWRAYIHKGGRYCHLGTFQRPEDAAAAYDLAAAAAYGEFAGLNFPEVR